MIDQTIKRAIFIPFIVVVAAKMASGMYDKWMDGTQDEMIANQEAFEAESRRLVRTENDAHIQMIVTENCTRVMKMEMCTRPKDVPAAGECLMALSASECDRMPSVHLCAAVEKIKVCADQFADHKKTGCDKLRRYASCDRKPAPSDLEKFWTLKLDDGLWHGPG